MQHENAQEYYAHGKLLLTGEYLVLSGAKALAIPLKYGQILKLKQGASCFLNWQATTTNSSWFKAEFNESLEVVKTDNLKLANKLSGILKTCINYQPAILDLLRYKEVSTHLEFDKDWGWGSSSTLISLLSQWLGVHPYHILQDTFGGSGYDMACATALSPIIYQRNNGAPKVDKVDFNPIFAHKIYFIYSGKKQSSQSEIARFNPHKTNKETIEEINLITDEILNCDNLHRFGQLMDEHEKIIGSIIQQTPVKTELFPDFKGYIKTLGAWGGDFMMAVSHEPESYIRSYFKSRELNTIFKFNDIKIS